MARRKKMREGECRKTKNGQQYCKRDGQVRFVPSGRRSTRRRKPRPTRRRTPKRRRALGGAGLGTLGLTCQRFKRVPVKGTRGKARRCAKFG